MREYATRRVWTIARQVKEIGSGASQREQLLEAARRREIDVVLVWRLDRWGRSVADLLATSQEPEHLGVGFVSLTEALDLTTPAGRAMAGLLADVAKDGRLLKHALYCRLLGAEGKAVSVILLDSGKQGIVSGIKPGQQVASNAPLRQNKVEY